METRQIILGLTFLVVAGLIIHLYTEISAIRRVLSVGEEDDESVEYHVDDAVTEKELPPADAVIS